MSTQVRRRPLVLTLALPALLTAQFVVEAAAPLLPFQGRLTDADGAAVPDGARVIQFKMYDAPVGGQAVWIGEVHKLTVNRGLVSTMLGSKASLATVDFDGRVFLELTIDANDDGEINLADPPLLPRQSIVPAVFANVAADARLLDGHDWSALLNVDENTPPTLAKMSGDRLVSGSVTSDQILERSITADRLAAGAVTGDEIKPRSIAGDRLMTNAVTGVEIATNSVLRTNLTVSVRESLMPAGAMVPFAGPAERVPPGWLLCDGRAVRTNDYPELYVAIGTAWGDGSVDEDGKPETDPETNFNLPDLRGYFLRGLDDRAAGQGKDADSPRKLGDEQDHSIIDHVHEVHGLGHQPEPNVQSGEKILWGSGAGWNTSGVLGPWAGGKETRPVNRAVNYLIKY